MKGEQPLCAESWWTKVPPGASMTQAAEAQRERQNLGGTKKLYTPEFPKRSGTLRKPRRRPI